jgi:hypothetical protein
VLFHIVYRKNSGKHDYNVIKTHFCIVWNFTPNSGALHFSIGHFGDFDGHFGNSGATSLTERNIEAYGIQTYFFI